MLVFRTKYELIVKLVANLRDESTLGLIYLIDSSC
jgi:hypothetical protein